jgi:hypothetical protein
MAGLKSIVLPDSRTGFIVPPGGPAMNALLLHILLAVHTLIGAVSTACLVTLFVAAWQGKSPASSRWLRVVPWTYSIGGAALVFWRLFFKQWAVRFNPDRHGRA